MAGPKWGTPSRLPVSRGGVEVVETRNGWVFVGYFGGWGSKVMFVGYLLVFVLR